VCELLGQPARLRTAQATQILRGFFQETPWFRQLHFRYLQESGCRAMELVSVADGQALLVQGDPATHFYMVVRGGLDVFEAEEEEGPAAVWHPWRSILTEIYLCHTCSSHEVLSVDTPGRWGWGAAPCRSRSRFAGAL
jgi:hypothetical protein